MNLTLRLFLISVCWSAVFGNTLVLLVSISVRSSNGILFSLACAGLCAWAAVHHSRTLERRLLELMHGRQR